MNDPLDTALSQVRLKWFQEELRSLLLELANYQTAQDYLAWDAKLKEAIASAKKSDGTERGLTKPEQQKNLLTDARNAIKVYLGEGHPSLEYVGFTTEEWEQINLSAEDRLSDRTTKFIKHPQTIADRAASLLDSSKWADVVAGLCVVTGRRVGEILKTARFEWKTTYSVLFTGALKRGKETENLSFEIPTLIPAKAVVDALAVVRRWILVGDLTPREINSRYEGAVCEACDRNFSDLVPPRDGKDSLYTHLFRAVYATIATHWYCPPSVPLLEFRAHIQGHFRILDEGDGLLRRSMAAQRNYFDYAIAGLHGNLDGRVGTKLGEPGVSVLEVFQPHLPMISTATLSEEGLARLEQFRQHHHFSSLDEATERLLAIAQWAEQWDTQFTPDARVGGISQRLSQHEPIASDESCTNNNQRDDLLLQQMQRLSSQFSQFTQHFTCSGFLTADEMAVAPSHQNAPPLEEAAVVRRLVEDMRSLSQRLEQIERSTISEQDLRLQTIEGELSKYRPALERLEQLASLFSPTQPPTPEPPSNISRRTGPQPGDIRAEIERVFLAILDFNERTSSQPDKWYPSTAIVRELTRRGQVPISEVKNRLHDEIEQHVQKHQLSDRHNRGKPVRDLWLALSSAYPDLPIIEPELKTS